MPDRIPVTAAAGAAVAGRPCGGHWGGTWVGHWGGTCGGHWGGRRGGR